MHEGKAVHLGPRGSRTELSNRKAGFSSVRKTSQPIRALLQWMGVPEIVHSGWGEVLETGVGGTHRLEANIRELRCGRDSTRNAQSAGENGEDQGTRALVVHRCREIMPFTVLHMLPWLGPQGCTGARRGHRTYPGGGWGDGCGGKGEEHQGGPPGGDDT